MKKTTLSQPLAAFVILNACEFDGYGKPPAEGDVVEIRAGKWAKDWRDGFGPQLAKVDERALRGLPQSRENVGLGSVLLTHVTVEGKGADRYWNAWGRAC